MAGAPTHSTPSSGPAKDVPTLWPYSDGDEEIINKAIKMFSDNNQYDSLRSMKLSTEIDCVFHGSLCVLYTDIFIFCFISS